MKPRRISTNQHTNQDHTSLVITITCYIKFAMTVGFIGVLEHKVITTQVQTEIAEANSFKVTHTLLVQIQCQ